MIKVVTEVRKVLILEFSLPGVEPSWSSSGGGYDKQLQQRDGERWQIKVNQNNALETADSLAALAKAIREAMA